jgi:hypothetical protein
MVWGVGGVWLHLVVVLSSWGVGHWGGAMLVFCTRASCHVGTAQHGHGHRGLLALALHWVGLAGGGCCCGLSMPGRHKAMAMSGDTACLGPWGQLGHVLCPRTGGSGTCSSSSVVYDVLCVVGLVVVSLLLGCGSGVMGWGSV